MHRLTFLLWWTLSDAKRWAGKLHKKALRDSSTDASFRLRGAKTEASASEKKAASGKMTRTEYPGVLASMQYWRTTPTRPASPYPELAISSTGEQGKEKYLSFETDLGGWNNIRLGVEICFVLAHVTGRTLILPAPQVLYLIDTPAKNLGEYYDLNDWKKGIKLVTPAEFVVGEKGSGLLTEADEQQLTQECGFDCARDNGGLNKFNSWMRAHALVPGWNGMGRLPLPSGSACKQAHAAGRNPYPYSAGGYRWDARMRDARIVHFASLEHTRMFGSFLFFFYFDSLQTHLFYARWLRDYQHYNRRIYALASPLVQKLGRTDSKSKGFGALHIRRNEFQFKSSWAPGRTIFENTKALFAEGQTVYISTDELGDDWDKRNGRAYFADFIERYDVRFLADLAEVKDRSKFPRHLTGMVEQLVCSQADVFVGTELSTYTGYIHQMRGYVASSGRAPWVNTAVHWTTRKYSRLMRDDDEHKLTKVRHSDPGNSGPWGRAYMDSFDGLDNW